MSITDRNHTQPMQASARILALCLPGDALLYLLLPSMLTAFGVTLMEAGILLAANRLVRIVLAGGIARLMVCTSERALCVGAVLLSAACALGYALATGFAVLLVLRLGWGLAYAVLSLSWQAHAATVATGAARRSGRGYATIALGPGIALPAGAYLASEFGRSPPFLILVVASLAALPLALRLPRTPHGAASATPHVASWPGRVECWAFAEGFVMDGLFILGFAYLVGQGGTAHGLVAAGCVLAARYGAEFLVAPATGEMAERVGTATMTLVLSLLTAAALLGFGMGLTWSCAAALMVLRAMKLPVMQALSVRNMPTDGAIGAVARRNLWRDVGAGGGPLAAGGLLAAAGPAWCYGVAGAVLFCTAALSVSGRPPLPLHKDTL